MTTACVAARSVRGRLKLRVEQDERGQSVLAERLHEGAFHLSKPYWDGQVLMVQWINPTAGVFAGDVLESEVSVGPGAAMLVTTPSATRIHTRVDSTLPAGLQHQRFSVAKGGWLEVQPEWLIPQRSSAFQQHTEIAVENGGGLFYSELLAPGRVAHGESLLFEELDLRMRLRVGGTLVVQERLFATQDRLWPLRASDGSPLFLGTVLIHLPDAAGRVAPIARECLSPLAECRSGISAVSASTMCLRLTATSSIPLRRALRQLREALATLHPPLRCTMRKL